MKKLLIAEKSEGLTDAMRRRFGDKFMVYTCSRGDAAMELIDSLQPDILWLDLSLPNMTGFAVLEKAGFSPPVCIARTNFISEDVLLTAESFGIKHIFRIPCTIEHIADCIEQYL